MKEPKFCPACGGVLPQDWLNGFCPACTWRGLCEPEEAEAEAEAGTRPRRATKEGDKGAQGGADCRPLMRVAGYEILEEIAQGGMGIVYRARQLDPRRTVALKMLLPRQAASPGMGERFRLEVRALTELDHPAILPVHQTGEHDGLPFFTMKLATGGSLAQRKGGFAGAWRQIAELMATLADAVQFAHERGILHRDLKPGNILFDEQNRAYVSDFGLAKVASADSGLTYSTDFLGTPTYVAPEVARHSAKRATTASDTYSLGAVLYELLAGRPPFEAEGVPALLKKIAEEEPNLKPRIQNPKSKTGLVPRDLEVICLKCLAKEPSRRYGSARELADDLRRWLAGKPIQARRVSAAGKVWLWARRRPAFAGLTLALVAAVAFGLLGIIWEWRRATQSESISQRNLYAADMNLVGQALVMSNVERARALLERHGPRRGETDLRGWEWFFFQEETRDHSAFTIPKRSVEVMRLSLSADGSTVAIPGGETNTVELWDMRTRQVRARLPIEASWVRYSNGGRLLAAFGGGRAALWDFDSNSVRREWPMQDNLNDAAFVSDDSALAVTSHATTSGSSPKLSVFSTKDGRLLQEQSFNFAGRSHAMALAVSPDGATLVMGASGSLHFFRLPDLVKDRTLPVHEDSITALAFSPDGRWLACGSGYTDNVLRLWDVKDGYRLYSLRGHSSWITSVSFTRDGRGVISGSIDQTARVWDLRAMTVAGVLHGHQAPVISVAASPDGRGLITATGREVKFWELQSEFSGGSRVTLPRLRGPVLSQDYRFFAGLDQQGTVLCGQVESPGKSIAIEALGTNLERVALSPDGAMIAAAGTNGVLRLAQRGERLRAIAQAHSGAVRHVVFIDNSALATIGEDRWVKTWSTDLQVRHAWQFGPECRLWIDNVAPDLKLFVADANGLPRRAFEMTDGRLVATLNSDGRTITGLAVSPDHRTLAISDDTGAVDLWDTRRWTLRARLRGHLTGVGHVAFSPDGRRLATGGSAMEAVKLWDAETLQQLCDLPVQSGYTTQLSFSSDGRSLAFNPTLYLHRSLQILLAPHP